MTQVFTSRALAEAGAKPRHGHDRAVAIWLLVCAAMIFAMVLLGGITRLSGSGLSIMEWKPLMGALPPMSKAEWERVFALYREIAQYKNVNAGMTLPEFQGIFWWEWSHRLLGRLLELMITGNGRNEMIRLLSPRFGRETFVGAERAAEIIVNAVIPVGVAAGIVLPHPRLLQAACWMYRLAPSRGSNAIVRGIERRYLAGRELRGAFWQQGAIEFHQRYLGTDRRALSMIAEPRGVMPYTINTESYSHQLITSSSNGIYNIR